ncbi:Dna repair protein rad51 [Thalictrum thalictroides]|uniref:Dna repair protein rad51 n=1 Tax=Thalictrum thalictroides TaxID=46969 RepID=A0A7J6VVD6_THATH|nr:Dna repair protein rad51 [Thalictrum thalictroides]
MSSLKSLETEHPTIDSNFQKFCASHGIFTVEDFLLNDVYVLLDFAEGHSNSKELKQGITQVLTIIDSLHPPWMNGVDLLTDAQRNKQVLSTGCQGLDLLLGGGLREGQLTELVGPSSSGKTQVCLQAATTIAYKYMASVVFVDTCNSFSSSRIAGFMERLLNPSLKEAKHKTLERIMSNVSCHSVFDIFGLLDLLHCLELKLRTQVKTDDCKLRLLIIDSISSLITPILGGGAHGHSLMVSAGFLLKKLVHEHDLSVLEHTNPKTVSVTFQMNLLQVFIQQWHFNFHGNAVAFVISKYYDKLSNLDTYVTKFCHMIHFPLVGFVVSFSEDCSAF